MTADLLRKQETLKKSSTLMAEKLRPLFLLLCAAVFVAPISAQRPGAPPPMPTPPAQTKPPQIDADDVVRITTNLVQVDAVVTDKDGQLVTDLKPEKVQILEDGKPQKITHFNFNLTAVSSPARP